MVFFRLFAVNYELHHLQFVLCKGGRVYRYFSVKKNFCEISNWGIRNWGIT